MGDQMGRLCAACVLFLAWDTYRHLPAHPLPLTPPRTYWLTVTVSSWVNTPCCLMLLRRLRLLVDASRVFSLTPHMQMVI